MDIWDNYSEIPILVYFSVFVGYFFSSRAFMLSYFYCVFISALLLFFTGIDGKYWTFFVFNLSL